MFIKNKNKKQQIIDLMPIIIVGLVLISGVWRVFSLPMTARLLQSLISKEAIEIKAVVTQYVILTNIDETDPYYQVVTTLRDHRNATVVPFDPQRVWMIKDTLKQLQPRYVAIVLKPIDIDINFAREFLMMSTTLDSDPFSDFSYGFITGATAQDALNFVNNIIRAETVDDIQNMPLTIGGYGASSLNMVYFQHGGYLDDLNPQSYASIRLKGDDDPHVNKDYFFENAHYLNGKKLIQIGGNGDPHMTWIFGKQDYHYILPDVWNYDPALVENPPAQRVGLTSDDIRTTFGNNGLYPAVAYNGACHSGALKRALSGGDISGTFGHPYPAGTPYKVTRLYEIQNSDFSYALSILRTGITGYFAPTGPNRVEQITENIYNTFLYNEPLGDIYKRSADRVVMGFLGNIPSFAMFNDRDSEPTYETLPTGTYNPSMFSGEFYISDKASGIYIGDPMFNPFTNNHETTPGTTLQLVTTTLTTINLNTLQLDLSFNQPRRYYEVTHDIFHDFGKTRIGADIELPPEYNEGYNIEVISASGPYTRIINALEEFDNKTILHLEIDIPQTHGDEIDFDISLNIKRTPVIWHYDLQSNSYGGGAAGDIDNDGKLEIVFGTYLNDEHLYALNAEDGSLLWRYRSLGGPIDTSVAVADVNGDGNKEVLFSDSSYGMLYCLDGRNGNKLWQFQLDSSTDSPPAIGDLDDDDKPEVVVGDFLGHVYVINGEDGTLVWKNNWSVEGKVNSGASLVDLDGDGRLDIVVASWINNQTGIGDNKVHALRGSDGQEIWSFQTGSSMYHNPSFADIDKNDDGRPELAFTSRDGNLYILNGEDGSLVYSEAIQSADQRPDLFLNAPTSLADLNNDGNLEIVVTGNNVYVYSYLYQESSLIKLWAYDDLPDMVDFPGAPSEPNRIFRGASIADMDDDGVLDLVFGSKAGILTILKGDTGEVLYTFDAKADSGRDVFAIDHAPLIGKFDGDNGLDIFFVGGRGYSAAEGPYVPENNHGRAYLIRGKGGTGKGWYMFRHDLEHSGDYSYVSKPSIDRVELTPTSAYKTTALTATPKGFIDPEASDSLSYEYQWFKNGVAIEGANLNRLLPEHFNKGDRIKCVVIPYNGTDYGLPKTSNTVTIRNHPPIVYLRHPEVVETYSGIIEIRWDTTDPDGDDLTNAPVDIEYKLQRESWDRWRSIEQGGQNDGVALWNTSQLVTANDYQLAVTVSDGQSAASNSYTNYKITIDNGPNNPPIIDPPIGDKIVDEGQLLNFTIQATDPDGHILTYSATGLPSGATLNSTTGEFSWTPTYNQAGSYPVTFTVSDGLLSTSETITITVNDVPAPNTPPSITGVNLTPTTAYKTSTLTATPTGWTDPDGPQQLYEYKWYKNDVVIEGATSNTLAPGNFVKGDNIKCEVTPYDGIDRGTPKMSSVVTIQNSRPVVTIISPQAGGTYSGTLEIRWTATDADGDDLNGRVSILYGIGTVWKKYLQINGQNNGSFLWDTTKDIDSNEYKLMVMASDGQITGSSTVRPFTINNSAPNQPPVLDPIGNRSVDEGSLLEFIISGSDPDGNSLTYSATGLPTGATFDPVTRTFSWTRTYDQVGPHDVTFTVSDGELQDSETITITVNNVLPPAAPSDLTVLITEVTSSQIGLMWQDNSDNELGFKIERATRLTGRDPFTQIAIVGADVTTYIDTNLKKKTTYYYRIRAYNRAGDSEYSHTVLAITLIRD